MEPDADLRAPGAAITVALCGHWDHEPLCPLAPHWVSVGEDDGGLRVRILFAAKPDTEGEVRHLIEQALSGQMKFPDGFTTPWQLRASWPSEVSAEENPGPGAGRRAPGGGRWRHGVDRQPLRP